MIFSERKKLVDKYRIWLESRYQETGYIVPDSHEAMLAFLEYNGLLKEPSPVCRLMRSSDDCDYYERENNYTLDWSDRCASCKFNKNRM